MPPRRRRKTVADYEAEKAAAIATAVRAAVGDKEAAIAAVVSEKELEKEAAIAAVVSEKEAAVAAVVSEKEAAIAAVVSEKELEKKAAFELGKLEGARYAGQCLCLVDTLCLMYERHASASCHKRCALWAAPSSPWR
jgi:hypothetical protein